MERAWDIYCRELKQLQFGMSCELPKGGIAPVPVIFQNCRKMIYTGIEISITGGLNSKVHYTFVVEN